MCIYKVSNVYNLLYKIVSQCVCDVMEKDRENEKEKRLFFTLYAFSTTLQKKEVNVFVLRVLAQIFFHPLQNKDTK